MKFNELYSKVMSRGNRLFEDKEKNIDEIVDFVFQGDNLTYEQILNDKNLINKKSDDSDKTLLISLCTDYNTIPKFKFYLDELISHGADINVEFQDGETGSPTHLLAEMIRVHNVSFNLFVTLYKAGAKISYPGDNESLLQVLHMRCYEEGMCSSDDLKIAKYLLENNLCKLSQRDNFGETVLDYDSLDDLDDLYKSFKNKKKNGKEYKINTEFKDLENKLLGYKDFYGTRVNTKYLTYDNIKRYIDSGAKKSKLYYVLLNIVNGLVVDKIYRRKNLSEDDIYKSVKLLTDNGVKTNVHMLVPAFGDKLFNDQTMSLLEKARERPLDITPRMHSIEEDELRYVIGLGIGLKGKQNPLFELCNLSFKPEIPKEKFVKMVIDAGADINDSDADGVFGNPVVYDAMLDVNIGNIFLDAGVNVNVVVNTGGGVRMPLLDAVKDYYKRSLTADVKKMISRIESASVR